LRRSSLRARIYIIAVEFFERRQTIPAKDVMQNPGSYFRYEVKRFWQRLHQTICGTVPAICRDRTAVYRSRQTGSYSLNLGRWTGGADNPPVFYDRETDQEKIKGYVASGREFLSRLPVGRDCIILTTIPTIRKTAYSYSPSVDTASAVANILGLSFVAPHVDALRTYDGSHLDRPSAERWSDAFLRVAGPQMQECLGKPLA